MNCYEEVNQIISQLSEVERANVLMLVDELCTGIERKGPNGYLAFALTGLRLQQEADKSNDGAEVRREAP